MNKALHPLSGIVCWIIIITLLLSACSPAVSPAIPSPTPTVQIIPTQTSSPIPSPTLSPTPNPTATQTPVPVGALLLYQSQLGDQEHLFLVDLDYGTRIQLTNGTMDYFSPGWSPDGWRIIYQVIQSGSSEIHVMDWDGKNDQKISRGIDADDNMPVISPDGKKIAYFSRKPGHWALFIMEINGKNYRPITENTVFESMASWSPDSLMIAFTSWHNTMSPPLISQIGVDGSNYIELTQLGLYEDDPKYSPDGSRIVFTCINEVGESPQICSINTDGSDRRTLTEKPGGNDMPVWSPTGEKIAFVSWRDSADPDYCENGDCNFEIYIMDADGSNQQRVTDHPAEDWFPAWSPDGKRLAFVSLRDESRHPNECGTTCNSEIYVMDADGSNVTRLTWNLVPDWNPQWRPPLAGPYEPASAPTETASGSVNIGGGQNQLAFWAQDEGGVYIYTIGLEGKATEGTKLGKGQDLVISPDGRQIAYVGDLNGDQTQIFIMDVNSKHVRQLTRSDDSAWDPAWSHDGKQIVYSNGSGGIHMINIDGTNEKRIIAGHNSYYAPAWSPDDRQIVFVGSKGGLEASLHIANRDGTKFRNLVTDADWSSPASWSPDGLWIAYGCNSQGEVQICLIRPDGSEKKVLTSQSVNGSPKWSPDGKWIAFCSYRDSNWEIYVMRSDGTDQRRVTEDWLENFGPVWWP